MIMKGFSAFVFGLLFYKTAGENGLATKDEFPFHAQIYKSGKFRCGGAILSPYHIITAATCLENYPADRITVTAGTNEFREEHGDSKMTTSLEQTRQAEGYVYHPSFVDGCDFVNNLGIIYLKEPFVFNSHVNAISLPDEQQELYLESAVRVGFGLGGIGSNSAHLKKVGVDFSDEEPCNNLTSRIWRRSFRKNELCGKSDFKSVDVCVLDAGAPIICKWSSSSTPFLCGLDALTNNLQQCEKEAYGIVNNIQEHLPFILDVLEYTTFRLKCDENHLYCPSSHTCLPRSSICNGIKDCEGGEDETNCLWENPCSEGRFRCNDGRCILLESRCDGENHCESKDNDFLTPDEEKCRKETEGVNCPEGLHSCGAGDRCISADWRCDGVKDCKDGSDEEQCNDVEAAQSSGIISKAEKIRNNWVLYGDGYYDNDYEKEEVCGQKPLPRGYVRAPLVPDWAFQS